MNELCRRYQESYGESTLPEELIRHGESCEECREFANRQQMLQQAMPAWRTPEFSSDFTLSVMSKLVENESRRRTFGDLLRELMQIRVTVPLPVGALAGILLLVSLWLNFAFWPQSQSELLNRSTSVAEGNNQQHFAMNPSGSGTPAAIPFSNGTVTGGWNGPLIVPREYLGAGAFLLVPILDPNLPLGRHSKEKPQADANRGI